MVTGRIHSVSHHRQQPKDDSFLINVSWTGSTRLPTISSHDEVIYTLLAPNGELDMSKRTRRRKPGASRAQACERKVGRFSTKAAAEDALDKFAKSYPWSHEKIVYRCHWCDDFHFGSPLGRVGQRRPR